MLTVTVPDDWPVGRLTMRSTPEGIPGVASTGDELAVDVITVARGVGFTGLTPFELDAVRRVGDGGEARLVGTVRLDPGSSAALAVAADRAVEWLNERMPAGHRVVLDAGLFHVKQAERDGTDRVCNDQPLGSDTSSVRRATGPPRTREGPPCPPPRSPPAAPR